VDANVLLILNLVIIFKFALCWICFLFWLINDWLFTVLRPAQEFFTHMETSPLPVKGCKFRRMLSTQGLWAGRDLYRATPAVTRDLGFSGLIWRTAPISRLLRHTWGCGGPILTRILTGRLINEIDQIFIVFHIHTPCIFKACLFFPLAGGEVSQFWTDAIKTEKKQEMA
jgi:hypothetical protein